MLKRNGFSGIDVCLPDYPNSDEHLQSVLVSTAIDDSQPVDPSRIQIISPATSTLSSNVPEEIVTSGLANMIKGTCFHVTDLQTFDFDEPCICLLEMQEPILETCSSAQWAFIQKLLTMAKDVLWVTRGGALESKKPEASLITGLARTARSDNHRIRLVTLDIDSHQESPQHTINVIANVFNSAFTRSLGDFPDDLEYVERGGRVYIPRLLRDGKLDKHLRASTSIPQHEVQPFFQDRRALRLEVGTPGLLDSMYFVEDESMNLPTKENELKIEFRAGGINFRDIMISLGQLGESTSMKGETSGVVTEVGSNAVNRFKVGDRVCCFGGTAYASHIRVSATIARHIPDNMTFETAASISIAFITAFYSLVEVANLKKGESVLIHSAAGGVGQSAVALSQHIGADIFVTVGNLKKKELLMKEFGIAEDRIFSSRETTFVQGIMRLTGHRGVDVVLNSLAGESARETCNCLATLGRFVEIGKRDALTNSRMDMAFFLRNITYTFFDLYVVTERDHDQAGMFMDRVFALIQQGALSLIKPITVLPVSQIESAFRLIQAGKHVGKIVVKADANTRVKVNPHLCVTPVVILSLILKALPPPPKSVTFRPDASYLVAGGLGGIGRATCRWMASLEATVIIVLSRSGLRSHGAQAMVKEMEDVGVKLVVESCDVDDFEQLDITLSRCAKELPPIRGVIQAAMVLEVSDDETQHPICHFREN